MDGEPVTARMSKSVHEKLKFYCDQNGRVMYKVIDEAVLKYLEGK